MRKQLRSIGMLEPKTINCDEISIRRDHTYCLLAAGGVSSPNASDLVWTARATQRRVWRSGFRKSQHKVSLGLVDDLRIKIRGILRCAHGLRDHGNKRLKMLTCIFPVF